ncbi:MAG: hypothetical protein RSB37_09550 [Acetivibrio sp.]
MIVAKTVNGFTLLQPVYKIEKVGNANGLQHFSTNAQQQDSSFGTLLKKAITSPKEEYTVERLGDCNDSYPIYNQKATEIYFLMRKKADYRC